MGGEFQGGEISGMRGDLRWAAGPPVGGDMVAGVRPQPPTA